MVDRAILGTFIRLFFYITGLEHFQSCQKVADPSFFSKSEKSNKIMQLFSLTPDLIDIAVLRAIIRFQFCGNHFECFIARLNHSDLSFMCQNQRKVEHRNFPSSTPQCHGYICFEDIGTNRVGVTDL